MRFLVKDPQSPLRDQIYALRGDNAALREALLAEQSGHCAYTERCAREPGASVDIEHFEPGLKGTPQDGHRNWYATLHSANQRKRRRERGFAGARFFADRWFQQPGDFDGRIVYVHGDFIYEPVDPTDEDAQRLIEYLDLNHPEEQRARRNHVGLLRDLLCAHGTDDLERLLARFEDNPSLRHYPTAVMAELGVDPLVRR